MPKHLPAILHIVQDRSGNASKTQPKKCTNYSKATHMGRGKSNREIGNTRIGNK